MSKLLKVLLMLTVLAVVGISPTFAAGKAMVRVMHASPDAPAVDVYVNGGAAFSNLEFAKATDYATLDAGTYKVRVFASAAKGAGNPAISLPSLALDSKPYTVLAIGKLSEIKPLLLEDNLAKPAAGKAHVRFVHAAADAAAVDITTKDGTVIFPNVAFGKATDFTPVAAGTYNLQARVAGTTTVALDVPNVTLNDGGIYMIVATGLLNGTPKLAANVVTYQPMATVLPTTGGDSSAMLVVALLAVAGVLMLGAGYVFRGERARN